jgi:hypothetical protein
MASTTQATTPASTTRTAPMLCAYSPRWLSGRTPGYSGLVARPGQAAEGDRSTDER